MANLQNLVKGFATIDNLALVNVEGTGMAGVPGTASAIFSAIKDVGANVIMISQASSEHSVCFAVPETEVKVVAEALQSRFRQALDNGRLSQVAIIPNCSILAAVGQKTASTPGVSAHPRDIDYPRSRKIAGSIGAFLMMDMAHISGLVAASVLADIFEFCDIVPTTTCSHRISC
ncbi:bifunctional aspartokinase/homoserine dehydrogenase 1, chloroplastic-like [Lathyrus oleraceus]|uniref:bifunctional aspartokinase/homoserine dehydrogenase 1, chloroplastic-like n=1 Tax=Pisum sativum TaxID=3888 RepID=UPI0021D368D6|nr:bifunctional aspartokinase/homoserine dehydrogenase 1, chloroplastic-like [Pisum sativum]